MIVLVWTLVVAFVLTTTTSITTTTITISTITTTTSDAYILLQSCSNFKFLLETYFSTSTILEQEVSERVLEDVHVRADYILGNLFILLIQK